jgi:hypothetical protein
MASQPNAAPFMGSSVYNKMRQAQAAAQAANKKASAGVKSKKQVILEESDDEVGADRRILNNNVAQPLAHDSCRCKGLFFVKNDLNAKQKVI